MKERDEFPVYQIEEITGDNYRPGKKKIMRKVRAELFICAWCKCRLSFRYTPGSNPIISHGICKDCKRKIMEEIVIEPKKP